MATSREAAATGEQMISASWVIPVVPEGAVLKDHAVVIQAEQILDVLPVDAARERYPNISAHTHLEGHALMPGLVNAHTHAAMSLFRGYADDLDLMDWLNNHIWPAEGRWVDDEFVRSGTRLAIAEMMLGGTTCFNDMYFFPEVTARVAEEMKMRATVGMIMIDFPSRWAGGPDEYLEKGLALHDELRHSRLVTTAFAPHAPYTVSDDPLRKIQTIADELDVPVHMHVHETAGEVKEATARFGTRPLERLSELGLVSPRLAAVHMTQLLDGEIDALADFGVSVVHCPESNLKLASGTCPVAQLLDAGVNVAIGTDGAASNNDLNMFSELRTAALLAKVSSSDPKSLPAAQALTLATIGGARAMGLESKIGSLEVEKQADMIAIDLSGVFTQPVYDPISQIVYSADRGQVAHSWIAGLQLVNEGQLVRDNAEEIAADASDWGQRMRETDS